MNLLQYRSDEMVSSTELIRKSKNIFNKLQKKEIEKAVILRDGKPQFMLLDFDTYEDLMSEYLSLKQMLENGEVKKEKKQASKSQVVEATNVVVDKIYEDDEIKKDELQKAFEEIEKLGLSDEEESSSKKDDGFEVEIEVSEIEKEKQPLKDFWE